MTTKTIYTDEARLVNTLAERLATPTDHNTHLHLLGNEIEQHANQGN